MRRRYTEKTYEALELIASFHSVFPGYKDRLHTMWIQLLDEGDYAFSRSNMRGHITASMLVLDPTMQECLLVDHLHHKLWLPPGGHIEDGTLAANALREVEEETGLQGTELIVSHPIHIDTHPITPRPAKNEGAHFHHDMLFLGLAQERVTRPQEEEVAEVRWWPLEEIANGNGHAADGARNAITAIKNGDRFTP